MTPPYPRRLSLTFQIIPLVPSRVLRDGKFCGGMEFNGRVWIVELNRRIAQLDAAQHGMLLARYTDSDTLLLLPSFCPHLVPLVELSGLQTWSIMFIGAVTY